MKLIISIGIGILVLLFLYSFYRVINASWLWTLVLVIAFTGVNLLFFKLSKILDEEKEIASDKHWDEIDAINDEME